MAPPPTQKTHPNDDVQTKSSSLTLIIEWRHAWERRDGALPTFIDSGMASAKKMLKIGGIFVNMLLTITLKRLRPGRGNIFDHDKDESSEKWLGHRGVVSPIKDMIVWTPNNAYTISFKDYDIAYPLTFIWFEPL